MAYGGKKTEHRGPKRARGAFYGRKAAAKKASNRRRREQGKLASESNGSPQAKRPKIRRAGCLLCKPWKLNGFSRDRIEAEQFGDHRRRLFADREAREVSR